jgi:hypothetical protein
MLARAAPIGASVWESTASGRRDGLVSAIVAVGERVECRVALWVPVRSWCDGLRMDQPKLTWLKEGAAFLLGDGGRLGGGLPVSSSVPLVDDQRLQVVATQFSRWDASSVAGLAGVAGAVRISPSPAGADHREPDVGQVAGGDVTEETTVAVAAWLDGIAPERDRGAG